MSRHLFICAILVATLTLMSLGSVAAATPPVAPTAVPTTTGSVQPTALQSTLAFAAQAGVAGQWVVSSTEPGWQLTTEYVEQGQTFTVSYVSGAWTVDYHLFPYVGPEGYTPDIDSQIFQGCKLDPSLPYGRLLGKIGDGAFFSVGRGGSFTASTAGFVSFHIHDNDACLGDNSGTVTMAVALGSAHGRAPDFTPSPSQGASAALTSQLTPQVATNVTKFKSTIAGITANGFHSVTACYAIGGSFTCHTGPVTDYDDPSIRVMEDIACLIQALDGYPECVLH
ncbi:MAG TPA: hypothetical protein VFI42_16970, partial [Thermomicrobiaceae bacterium]|nr:hypothetical protein [Thermomicrobiaceae bacterium]